MEIEQDITELAATQATEMVQSLNQDPHSTQVGVSTKSTKFESAFIWEKCFNIVPKNP